MSKQSAGYLSAGSKGDARGGENGSLEAGARSKSRGTTDLPKNVASLCAVLQNNLAGRGRGQSRTGLKNENGVRIVIAI